jgi:pimeloyl-ACP methyl ester carboxylesterase
MACFNRIDRDACKYLELKNGGRIAFAQYGLTNGPPVFFFHGWPSSRMMAELTDAPARELGMRIISPDRPGIWGSTFQKNRKLLDWPSMVDELANDLGIERFRVIAISGGAPYAFATAYRLAARVDAIAIVSGAPPIADLADRRGLLPLYRLMLHFYKDWPRFSRSCFHLARPFLSVRPPRGARPLLLKLLRMRPSDAAALRDAAAFEACFESQRRAWRTSAAGVLADAEIYARPWGFNLHDINAPVRMWHGTEDRAFSFHLAEEVAKQLPNCRLRLIANEGHYSLPIRRMREILQDLVSV